MKDAQGRSYTVMDLAADGDAGVVTQCLDCGDYVVNGKMEDIKHHSSCMPGESEKWEEYYEQEDSDSTF